MAGRTEVVAMNALRIVNVVAREIFAAIGLAGCLVAFVLWVASP